MRLQTIEFKNLKVGWDLNPVSFGALTLLVGISGAGKTRILKSILDLKRIAAGASLSGACWSCSFVGTEGEAFQWKGQFETLQGETLNDLAEMFSLPSDSTPKAKLESETLLFNGDVVAQRNAESIRFKGKETPKLSPTQSVLSLLKEEEPVKQAAAAFSQIVHSDHVDQNRLTLHPEFPQLSKRYTNIDTIRDSALPTPLKLALCHQHEESTFRTILTRFQEIFPTIADAKMEPMRAGNLPAVLSETPFLFIKEKGVEQWVSQLNMSSGMWRTMVHLSELYLSPDKSLVLIDEFENSLGVNCIDVLTQSIVDESRRLQFIITSHHPYIINNIPMTHWKVVRRTGSTVSAYDAKDLGLGKSSHDGFLQLLNLKEYRQGICVN